MLLNMLLSKFLEYTYNLWEKDKYENYFNYKNLHVINFAVIVYKR